MDKNLHFVTALWCPQFPLFLCFALIQSSFIHAQISGTITDANQDPLPFATIHIEGSSLGTTANVEGYYRLDVAPGNYTIVYRYVGFEEIKRQIEFTDKAIDMDVQLKPSSFTLDAVEIVASAEDPAYAIIRKTIAKRPYYKDLLSTYSCDTYMKGLMQVANVPEKIFGVEVGDIEGSLDSNRQGIVYFSESESKLYKDGNKVREVMISSKVSGDDQGFSFNRASDMEFNLYEPTSKINRNILSPIADGAFGYYNYKLEGVTIDENGHLINKIKVIPKRPQDPVFSGFLYIVEDLWVLKETSLYVLKDNIGLPVIDSLHFKQVYINLDAPEHWKILSQNIYYDMGFFGVTFEGQFTGIFSNYNIDTTFDDNFFTPELLTVTRGSNKKDSIYWNTNRPIPLSPVEKKEYIKKDSIVAVRSTKSYMDSVDQENNKIKPIHLITGHTISKSYEKLYFRYDPLSAIGFNTVQGLNLDLDFRVSKNLENLDNYTYGSWWVNPRINYGFSEEKFRFFIEADFRLEEVYRTQLNIKLGSRVEHINNDFQFSNFENTFTTLLNRKNYAKFYALEQYGISATRRLFPALDTKVAVSYNARKPLVNTTEYSFANDDDRAYTSNNPINPADDTPAFLNNELLQIRLSFTLHPGTKFISYPGRRWYLSSEWPRLNASFQKGVGIAENKTNYDWLQLSLYKYAMDLGLAGFLTYKIQYENYLNSENLTPVDFNYANGKTVFWGDGNTNTEAFKMLDFYQLISTDENLEIHLDYNFNGFIMDKIPLLRKLKSSLVINGKYYTSETIKNYSEFSVGLGNLGIGLFKFLRLDYVWSFSDVLDTRNGFFLSFGFD